MPRRTPAPGPQQAAPPAGVRPCRLDIARSRCQPHAHQQRAEQHRRKDRLGVDAETDVEVSEENVRVAAGPGLVPVLLRAEETMNLHAICDAVVVRPEA